MKVMFVAPRFHTNQYYVVDTLLKNGDEVIYVSQYVGGSEDHSLITPKIFGYSKFFLFFKKLYNFINKTSRESFRFERQFGIPPIKDYLSYIKNFSPDYVIVRDTFFFGLLTFILCRKLGINVILYRQIPKHVHKSKKSMKIVKKLKLLIYQILIKKIMPKVMITPINGKGIMNPECPSRTYYLPFIIKVNEKKLKEKKYFSKDRINIISIGKFVPRKRHLLLLEVVKRLKKKYDISLTIIGELTKEIHEIEYKKVVDFISENHLEGLVNIKTNLEFNKVQQEYLNHDLFILPSINEELGVSVLEAMAHKLPVICSDTAGAQDYIEENYNGYVFKSDDVDDLENKITKIIKERKKHLIMGERSLELVKDKYSPERYYKELRRILNTEFGFPLKNKIVRGKDIE
ncbi:glycosyltransferase family 4 protein [Gracilibacillus lacisalsi]|uniref:glycosyltransferase family 4 protein n=1 Tax=Gracilibacillus lacisalsi TaxID=393087 RepID=UPI00035CD749|nr:glycosyltransferase family 4 protein [Gracilibacillus lacisalsi]